VEYVIGRNEAPASYAESVKVSASVKLPSPLCNACQMFGSQPRFIKAVAPAVVVLDPKEANPIF